MFWSAWSLRMRDPSSPKITSSVRCTLLSMPRSGPFKRERMLFIPVGGNGSLKEPTVDQCIDRIVAHNHNELLPPGIVLSRHDVGMVVRGITADSCGLPVMRVAMDGPFTYDLGTDELPPVSSWSTAAMKEPRMHHDRPSPPSDLPKIQ